MKGNNTLERYRPKFLVFWHSIYDNSDNELPMRIFDTRDEAEAYRLGCADILWAKTKKGITFEEVVDEFLIMEAQ